MIIDKKKIAKVLKDLILAVDSEVDLDACSSKLGRAITEARLLIDTLTETERNDKYMDQSKW